MAKKKKPARRPAPADAPAIDFEKSVAEIERLVDQIEQGELGLEQSVAAYERGMGLIKSCRAALSRAEQRIIELTRDADLPGAGDDEDEDDTEEDDD